MARLAANPDAGPALSAIRQRGERSHDRRHPNKRNGRSSIIRASISPPQGCCSRSPRLFQCGRAERPIGHARGAIVGYLLGPVLVRAYYNSGSPSVRSTSFRLAKRASPLTRIHRPSLGRRRPTRPPAGFAMCRMRIFQGLRCQLRASRLPGALVSPVAICSCAPATAAFITQTASAPRGRPSADYLNTTTK